MDEQNSGVKTESADFADAPPFPWDDTPQKEKPTPEKEIVQQPVEKTVPEQPLQEPVVQISESSKQQAGLMSGLKSFFGKLTKKRDLLQEIEGIENPNASIKNIEAQDIDPNPVPITENTSFQNIVHVPEPTPNNELLELTSRLGSMEEELNDLRNRTEIEVKEEDKDEQESELIKAKINETSDAVSALQEQINLIEDNVKSFDENRMDISESFEGVKNQIQEIMQLQANQGQEIKSTIEETISRHESALENNSRLMETEINGIKESQKEIKTEVSGLSSTIAGLMEDVAHVSQQGKANSDKIQKHEDNFKTEIEALKELLDEEVKKTGSQGLAGESVQLTKIVKNSTNTKLCMEWLEFLMELVGRNNLPEILAYYEELEWINDEVRLELMRYAEGIDYYVEKPDWKLAPDDHVKSIWFIEKLAGLKVDKNQLSVIERDIKKVKGGNEIYGI
ncbi:archaellum component FlaD/FlaE [Methanohalophilus levihalophilus]|uniref:FlaD/FlaE family flagellar protein n=1 Tax=Methanohalophilus levihalophilus TaxID=1431282 RepID=UPI001AE2B1DD|nr:FlaD/FlaE family flagellar protein [Methanohalophilus levihalophilus]MBP2031035.1 archaellum component FlaD/FlaE [Methanohalophilus levihalophilus]